MMNIDLFDEYTGDILARLYQAFPVPIGIDARTLCGHRDIDDFGRIIDEQGRVSKPFEIAISTLNWLESAGLITSRQKNQIGHAQVTLTAKGLELLNAVPDALKSKEATGVRLSRLMREGSLAMLRETVKAVIAASVTAGFA